MTVSHRKTKVAAKTDDRTGELQRRYLGLMRMALREIMLTSYLANLIHSPQLQSPASNITAISAKPTLP